MKINTYFQMRFFAIINAIYVRIFLNIYFNEFHTSDMTFLEHIQK